MPFNIAIAERLIFLLVLAPFVSGRFVAAAVILGLILLIRHTRKLTERIDGLRKTMNEAIIHDLKNPMAAVMGCLSCAIGDELAPAHRTKLLSIALHSCRVQMSLLDTLVDTSRFEHGELVARKQAMGTREFLAAAIEDIGGTARYLGVRLESRIAPDIPPVIFADRDLLPRAVYNLLHNALKYSAPKDAVSLTVGFSERSFRFEIKDTGIGIAPDHIARLFKKYYRVEGPDQTGRRGSGLGLYFCRLVIEAHGGAITVSSEVGQGTIVSFSIPQPEETGGSPHEPIGKTAAEQAALA